MVNGDFVYSTGYNANNGPPPNPGCVITIGSVCYPAPPFDAANTSDTKPHGTVRIRVWEIATFSLSLSANSTELHPWIRYFQPNVTPPPFIQQGSPGEAATVTATASLDGVPLANQQVDVRGEILPSGGHAHLTAPMDLGVAHLADLFIGQTSLPGDGKPVAGMFAQSGDTTTTLSDVTNGAGEVSLEFVAGFVSGDIDIIGSTVYNGITYEDTLRVTVRVPDLVALDADADVLANALIIGATSYHPTDSHYGTAEFFAAARNMVVGEHRTDGGQDYYLQLNDASLPLGGAFTVEPPETATGVRLEQPGMGHRAHALGVDEDISWCYALTNGVAGTRINGTDCAAAGTSPVDPRRLRRHGFAVLIEAGTEPHYHIRLEGQ